MTRSLALVSLAFLLAGACSPADAHPARRLAAEQVLRLAATADVQTLDPAKVHQPSVELGLVRSVFGGLYRFDSDLRERDDLATGPPEVSADGLVWTFHLRKEAVFSNGDPVRAADVLYSWNRLAALTEYASSVIFDHLVGYPEVAAKRSRTMSGLSAPDEHTVVAHLQSPAGWWMTELGLWPTAVVDERVVEQRGEQEWWRTPEGLVGTGPYRMSRRSPGALEFVPVARWWRGSTGNLRRIRVEVVADEATALRRYADNLYDIVGYLPPSTAQVLSDATILKYRGKPDLRTRPWLRTSFIGYQKAGRLSSAAADPRGRQALSQALQRSRLASLACAEGTTCVPATGGLIPKGLAGYLGDQRDPNSKYDLGQARSLLAGWDPDGTRRKGLRLGASIFVRDLASAIVAEWQEGLGLDLQVQIADGQTISQNARRGSYDITIGGFVADFDSPANWFHDQVGGISCAESDPEFRTLTTAADLQLPAQALPLYRQAGQRLADDAACPALVYLQGVFLIKPWVSGAGGNALYEFDWTGISIFDH